MEEPITILTRTPLWTASRDSRTMETVQASAIIGGLRWWYEVIVRGMGYYACDPSDQNSACQKKDDEPPAKLCPACRLFGATGWARRFNLQLMENGRVVPWPSILDGEISTNIKKYYNEKKKRFPTYYFPDGYMGKIKFQIIEKFPDSVNTTVTIFSLLDLIGKCGALGSKTGLSYGLFRLLDRPEYLLPKEDFLITLKKDLSASRVVSMRDLPRLDKFFFCNVEISKTWTMQDFVNFKCRLRADFRGIGDTQQYRQLRHELFGYVMGNSSISSKIKMGLLPEGNRLKLWGWVPESKLFFPGMHRNDFIDFLKAEIRCISINAVWTEYDQGKNKFVSTVI